MEEVYAIQPHDAMNTFICTILFLYHPILIKIEKKDGKEQKPLA